MVPTREAARNPREALREKVLLVMRWARRLTASLQLAAAGVQPRVDGQLTIPWTGRATIRATIRLRAPVLAPGIAEVDVMLAAKKRPNVCYPVMEVSLVCNVRCQRRYNSFYEVGKSALTCAQYLRVALFAYGG